MPDIALNVAAFRAQFPAFASTSTYPDTTLDGYFSFATNYISATPQCWPSGMNANQQTVALNLLAAHLATLGQRIAQYGSDVGLANGVVTSKKVADVSYTLEPPKAASAFGQWLIQTPYGQQLYSLLDVASVGGFYFGTNNGEYRSIRKAGGRF